MSKTCKNCGEELKDTARTCPKCGKPADPPEQPYLNRKVKKTPWIDGSEASEKPKKKSYVGIVIAAVIFVAVVAAGMYWLAKRSPDDTGAVNDSALTQTATAAVTSDEPEPALKKLADEGRISSKITAVDKGVMKAMIQSAQSLEYTETSEQEFIQRILALTGCKLEPLGSGLSAFTAENDSFLFTDACDDENEAYLVFDKKEKTMFILSRKLDSDGYWMCEKVANENIAARYSGGKQNDSEVHYVLGETGETVFFGKTADGVWCFYYNDAGELFLCMDNTDISNPKFYNGDFLSMDSFAGKLVLQTVLDNIKKDYGKELIF